MRPSVPARPSQVVVHRLFRSTAALPAAAGLPLPRWVREHFGLSETIMSSAEPSGSVFQRRVDLSPSLMLVSFTIANASDMNVSELRDAVATLYREARQTIAPAPFPHLVRVWHFVPGIHEPMSDELDRYRAMNLGRYEGFQSWFGHPEEFPRSLPASTAVGHDGRDLRVHFLCAATAGWAVENPRQRSALCYSTRYGPRPPCFVRATRVQMHSGERLIIAGTASIQGEDTVHDGELVAQLRETIINLSAVIRVSGLTGSEGALDVDAMRMIKSARVYYVHAEHQPEIERFVRACMPNTSDLEFVQATICRTDLLLEIEAVAAPAETPIVGPSLNGVLA